MGSHMTAVKSTTHNTEHADIDGSIAGRLLRRYTVAAVQDQPPERITSNHNLSCVTAKEKGWQLKKEREREKDGSTIFFSALVHQTLWRQVSASHKCPLLAGDHKANTAAATVSFHGQGQTSKFATAIISSFQ